MQAAGFLLSEDSAYLTLPAAASLAAVQHALTALQNHVSSRQAAKARAMEAKESQARQAYLDEAKQKKAEADRRRAAAKAKISGQKREEKEVRTSVSQHKGFGSGDKQSATALGAGGDAKGG